jgi:hypothetical protein
MNLDQQTEAQKTVIEADTLAEKRKREGFTYQQELSAFKKRVCFRTRSLNRKEKNSFSVCILLLTYCYKNNTNNYTNRGSYYSRTVFLQEKGQK